MLQDGNLYTLCSKTRDYLLQNLECLPCQVEEPDSLRATVVRNFCRDGNMCPGGWSICSHDVTRIFISMERFKDKAAMVYSGCLDKVKQHALHAGLCCVRDHKGGYFRRRRHCQ